MTAPAEQRPAKGLHVMRMALGVATIGIVLLAAACSDGEQPVARATPSTDAPTTSPPVAAEAREPIAHLDAAGLGDLLLTPEDLDDPRLGGDPPAEDQPVVGDARGACDRRFTEIARPGALGPAAVVTLYDDSNVDHGFAQTLVQLSPGESLVAHAERFVEECTSFEVETLGLEVVEIDLVPIDHPSGSGEVVFATTQSNHPHPGVDHVVMTVYVVSETRGIGQVVANANVMGTPVGELAEYLLAIARAGSAKVEAHR